MATIDKKQLTKIKKLYSNGFSVANIAKELNVSLDATYYFFRKYDIKRRNRSESNVAYFKKKKTTFKIKNKLSVEEKKLKVAGMMLYWAEGSKWSGEKNIDFANSDPKMIKIFLIFLRRICGIDESKLRVYLYCYRNQNPEELKNYWSKITKISKNKFTKPYIKQDFKKDKKGKMKYGLIHIRYYDKKLFLLMMDWINNFKIKI